MENVNAVPEFDMQPCKACGRSCNHSGGSTPFCDTRREETYEERLRQCRTECALIASQCEDDDMTAARVYWELVNRFGLNLAGKEVSRG